MDGVQLASIGSLYERAIVDSGRQPEFLFFVAFLASWGFIRTSAHLIRAQVSWWPGNVEVGGTHIHHLVWGILLLLVFGYVGVVAQPPSPWQEIVTIGFGIGAGLTLDEFALWLELKDVYWEEQGRKSIDAVVVTGCLSGIVLVGYSAWLDVATGVEDAVIAAGTIGALGIAVALTNAAKQRFGWAVASLFVPVLGLVPALRLAKPSSLWARWFYREDKLERARSRWGLRYPAPRANDPAARQPGAPPSPPPAGGVIAGRRDSRE